MGPGPRLSRSRGVCTGVVVCLLLTTPLVPALDSPWISDTFFYWYTWDRQSELGGWLGGVHNTPLQGYYDSRTFEDNYRSLHCASEWGLTHHFMDYWSPDWKDENGEMREKTVMRAAEKLRTEGYDIWMGYYQDGTNFEMKDFARNVSEQRDVYQWLRDFSASPVWPRLNNRPLQLVYCRNGSPIPTTDQDAYRTWLGRRYADVAALNRDWGTALASLDEARLNPAGRGPQRAAAVEFIYETWRQDWEKLQALVRQGFHLPGMVASFDIGYKPFRGFGYAGMARTFCGPHSYGGIFAEPHAEDTDRYIQAQVAKHCNTVFFDHFKNYYHDWNIRIPGTAYLPDPFNFDRFWVGALMRRSEALLHLSWNEWWEGSNLEPSREFGKTYCEKNLFYATLMKRGFASLRQVHCQARIGLVLNDYAFRCGTRAGQDLLRTIVALRRLNADFDLVPDERLSAAELKRFRVVVAPACAVGFGRTEAGEEVLDLLMAWAEAGGRLVVSADDRTAARLGCAPVSAPAPAGELGPDLNLLVDVGVDADGTFLLGGCSFPENWANLPAGKFGAGQAYTVRWTPADGQVTTLSLPASPRRDHVLRFAGSAVWENTVSVRAGAVEVGTIAIQPGYAEYEVPVPASAIGARSPIELELVYAQAHVPGERDPEHYAGEARVCALALDWVQFSTANIAAHAEPLPYSMPRVEIEFTDPLFAGLQAQRPVVSPAARRPLQTAPARTAARYSTGEARDLLFDRGQGRVLYVNGSFADFASGVKAAPEAAVAAEADWWNAVLCGYGAAAPARWVQARAGDVGGDRIALGSTDLLLAYNYSDTIPARALLRTPARDIPLAEAAILRADDVAYQPLAVTKAKAGDHWEAEVPLRYFAVCAFVHAPVRLELPRLEALPGERVLLPVQVTNLTEQDVDLTLAVTAIIPTLRGEPVSLRLGPKQKRSAMVPVQVAESAEWGRKTVVIEVQWAGQTADFVREFTILSPPQFRLTPGLTQSGQRAVTVEQVANPHGAAAPCRNLKLGLSGRVFPAGNLSAGESRSVVLDRSDSAAAVGTEALSVRLEYQAASRQLSSEVRVDLPVYPRRLKTSLVRPVPVLVSNSGDQPLGPWVVAVKPPSMEPAYHVFDANDRPVPCQQLLPEKQVVFAAVVPAHGTALYWLSTQEAKSGGAMTDLHCEVAGETGSGQAVVVVENSFYRVAISEAAGGTVTEFVSKRTGRNYARRSFDLNLGEFAATDKPGPCWTTTALIREQKLYLSAGKAEITRLERGPLRVVVGTTRSIGGVNCQTRLDFQAFSDHFQIQRGAALMAGKLPEEIVVLDTDFAPGLLRKSYPGFAGVTESPSQPHFGWRYSDWVPELITLLDGSGNEEAISLALRSSPGIDRVRQGFWPARRPEPGPLERARVEYVSRRSGTASLVLDVRVHPGYHRQGRQWAEAVANIRVGTVRAEVEPGPAPAPIPSDWWHPAWAFRARFELRRQGLGSGDCVTVPIDFAGATGAAEFDPGSVRVFERRGDWVEERPCLATPAGQAVLWQVGAGETDWPRPVEVYFDRRQTASKPRADWDVSALALDRWADDFEAAEAWDLAGASRAAQGRDASQALVFANDGSVKGPLLATCRRLRARPGARYRLHWSAKATGPEARLAANLYDGPRHDFPQVHTPLNADGQWHDYETVLVAGEFPDDVRPRLRLWTMPGSYTVAVDDVTIELVGATTPVPAAAAVRVESLPLAAR